MIGGGGRLMVSAVCGKTCIFFIQDKILFGERDPPSRLFGGGGGGCPLPPPPLPAPMMEC